MPSLTINGPNGQHATVNVGDEFLQLSPQAQQAWVNETAGQIFAQKQAGSTDAPQAQAPAPAALTAQNISRSKNAVIPRDPVSQFMDQGVAGLIKGIGGIVQSGADLMDATVLPNNLGSKVGNLTEALADAITQGDGNPSGISGKIAQTIGQSVPFLLGGGEASAAEKGAGLLASLAKGAKGGLIAGATNLEQGGTAQERNQGREQDALTGAILGGPLGMTSQAAGKFATRLVNSKQLSKAISKILDTINEDKPDVTAVAKDVGGKFTQATKTAQSWLGQLDKMVADRGNVDLTPLDGVVGQIKKLTRNTAKQTPATSLLSSVGNVLQQATNTKGPDYDAVLEALGNQTNPAIQKKALEAAQQKGFKVFKKPDNLPFSHAVALSQQIGLQLDKMKDDLISPAGRLLTTAKNQIDNQLDEALAGTSNGQRIWEGVQKNYFEPTLPLRSGFLQGLLSPDPALQVESVRSLLQSGDADLAKTLSQQIGPTGQKQVVRLALNDALINSFDKKANTVNAATFDSYFKDPATKKVLEQFSSPQDEKLIKGFHNFVATDAHTRPGTGMFGTHTGELATSFGMFDAMKQAIDSLGKGHLLLAVKPIVAALGANAAMRATMSVTNGLLDSIAGRNFFNAMADVTPGTPKAMALIQKWRPRLTQALIVSLGQQAQGHGASGGGQQPPAQGQGISIPQMIPGGQQ